MVSKHTSIGYRKFPVKFFRRVMQHFWNFSPVLWHYRRHVVYRCILYTIMYTGYTQNRSFTAIRRRYIAADYIMLHNVFLDPRQRFKRAKYWRCKNYVEIIPRAKCSRYEIFENEINRAKFPKTKLPATIHIQPIQHCLHILIYFVVYRVREK